MEEQGIGIVTSVSTVLALLDLAKTVLLPAIWAPSFDLIESTYTASKYVSAGVYASFACAFASLAWQASSLFGDEGVAPARQSVEHLRVWLENRSSTPPITIITTRTVIWFWRWVLGPGHSSDRMEQDKEVPRHHGACFDPIVLPAWIGCGISLAGLIIASNPISGFVVTFTYLAYRRVGSVFLNFQWDHLLLEVSFVAFPVLTLSESLLVYTEENQSLSFAAYFREDIKHFSIGLSLWLIRCVLFRLMFGSGAVKLLSKDPAWRWPNFSALQYHYFTQPLPNAFGLWLHAAGSTATAISPLTSLSAAVAQLFHRVSTAIALATELLLPPLIFIVAIVPDARWATICRVAFVWPTLAMQIAIAVTGNFGFFNLLTSALLAAVVSHPQTSNTSTTNTEVASPLEPSSLVGAAAAAGMSMSTFPRTLRFLSAIAKLCIGVFWFVPLALAQFAALSATIISRSPQKAGHWMISLKTPYLASVARAAAFCQRHLATTYVGSHYGLFANMTKSRAELVVEGCCNPLVSNQKRGRVSKRKRSCSAAYDGSNNSRVGVSEDEYEWEEIPFRYKPCSAASRPAFSLFFHLPRLDWRLWFVALQPSRHQAPRWLLRMLDLILARHRRFTSGNVACIEHLFVEGAFDIFDDKKHSSSDVETKPLLAVRVVVYDFTWSCSGQQPHIHRASWQRTNRRVLVPPVWS